MDKKELLSKHEERFAYHKDMLKHIKSNLYRCSKESKLHGQTVDNSAFSYEPKDLDAALIEDIAEYIDTLIDQLAAYSLQHIDQACR